MGLLNEFKFRLLEAFFHHVAHENQPYMQLELSQIKIAAE